MQRILLGTFLLAASPCAAQTVIDYDGNSYETVAIGNQLWTASNMKATHYADGVLIPYNCFPDGDPALEAPFGRLYTWNAATRSATVEGAQGICPNGWHVPTDAEWMTLIEAAGGDTVAGSHLKSTSTLWQLPNVADNSTGFSALPAGNCYSCGTGGSCDFLSTHAEFWTSTPIDANSARNWSMYYLASDVFRHYNQDKPNGFSVRCVFNWLVGMEELHRQIFHLRPNPTQESATLELTADAGPAATVTLQDMAGRVIRTVQMNGQRILSFDGLSPAAYVITVTDGRNRWQDRLIVQ